MNIDGVVRALPLFAPPVNPAALVAAAAAGSTARPVAAQLNLPVPFYRFTALIQRVKELAAAVALLGGALLAALEKKDAEALAVLQVSQQQAILDMSTSIKELAVEQTAQTSQALASALASAQARQSYYDDLIATGLSPQELANFAAMAAAAAANIAAGITRTSATVGYLAPQVGSPFAMTYGGKQIGAALFSASVDFRRACHRCDLRRAGRSHCRPVRPAQGRMDAAIPARRARHRSRSRRRSRPTRRSAPSPSATWRSTWPRSTRTTPCASSSLASSPARSCTSG